MARRMNHDKANRFSKAKQDVREALEDGDISEITAWIGDDKGLDKLGPTSYVGPERVRGTVAVVHASSPIPRPAQSTQRSARPLMKSIISSGRKKQKSTSASSTKSPKSSNKAASSSVSELKKLLTEAEIQANCQKLADSLCSVKIDVALALLAVAVKTNCAGCRINLKAGKKFFALFNQPNRFVCHQCAFSIQFAHCLSSVRKYKILQHQSQTSLSTKRSSS